MINLFPLPSQPEIRKFRFAKDTNDNKCQMSNVKSHEKSAEFHTISLTIKNAKAINSKRRDSSGNPAD